MLIGTQDYERNRGKLNRDHNTIDPEDLDPCGKAREMMNELAMKALQEAHERRTEERARIDAEKAINEQEKLDQKNLRLEALKHYNILSESGKLMEWNNIMQRHQSVLLERFIREHPDFLRTIDTERMERMLESSVNAVKKTRKKEQEFHRKVADILQKELDRKQKEEII